MGFRCSRKTPSAGRFVTRACCTVLASAGIAWGTGDVPVTQIPNDGETIAVRSWLVSGMFPSPDLAAQISASFAPISSAIDRGRAYRVVTPTWMLWDLGGAHHYNPENVELVDADALVDLYRREEWGVRDR